MHNFYSFNPTKILFGKGMTDRIPNEIPPASRILLVYGGGSIKENGVYDRVVSTLKGHTVSEFGGVESNPEYETCIKAVRLAKKNRTNFILAVGGGSVIDASKFIALAYHSECRNPWEWVTRQQPAPAQALPIGCVQTLPATGSEANNGFVLSQKSTRSKVAFSHISLFPRFSVLDPEFTYSLSPQQTALGIVDMFVHVLEQYITYPNDNPLQDRQAEAILTTLVEIAGPLLQNLTNYHLRATTMWCATQAFNGTIGRGVPQDWATHAIGQMLTALFDIPHGQTLALILGGVYRHGLAGKLTKLAQYGRRVWHLVGDDAEIALASIRKTEEFFESIGIPTRISALGMDANQVAQQVVENMPSSLQKLGERADIGLDDVRKILLSQT